MTKYHLSHNESQQSFIQMFLSFAILKPFWKCEMHELVFDAGDEGAFIRLIGEIRP